jgi:amidase
VYLASHFPCSFGSTILNYSDLTIDDPLGAFCSHSQVRIQGAPHGLLAGTRFGVKDLYHVKGFKTGFGHPAWLDSHPAAEVSSAAMLSLLSAGASVVGKTHCDELCFSLNGVNKYYGTPVNVNAPGCIPGGSSSGSAAAVAGGLVDFALGSDTGGSIRVPASYCGILGIRPSHGAVSLDGALPFAPSFDTAGWFANSPTLMRDIGRVLLPAHSLAEPRGQLLVATDAFSHVDESTSLALNAVVQQIGQAFTASRAVNFEPDGLDPWMHAFRVIQGSEIWQTHRDWLIGLGPEFGDGIRERFKWVSTISPEEIASAKAVRLRIRDFFDQLLVDNAVLVIPTTPGPAPLLDTSTPDLEKWRNRSLGLLCIAGHAGLPQLSIPLAQVQGRPIGLSFIAARGKDHLLLELACSLEKMLATDASNLAYHAPR